MATDSTWLPLGCLQDNYAWRTAIDSRAYLVDPGEVRPCLDWLQNEQLQLDALLITHRHADHVDGIGELIAKWPDAQVIAPSEYSGREVTRTVAAGDNIELADGAIKMTALATPGHTRGHLSYLGAGFVLAGDALFVAGCGRLFEGDGNDLLASMEVFRALPEDTQLCCGHEYTLGNLAFARLVEPDNQLLQEFCQRAEKLRAEKLPTVPTTIGQELAINPFLRYDQQAVIASVCHQAGRQLSEPADIVLGLRRWKDSL